MKEKVRLFFKTFIICSMCFVIFIGVGYFYLSKNFEETDNKAENIPYTQTLTENAGILLCENGNSTFFYLDFSDKVLTVSLTPEDSFEGRIYGYSHNYTVTANWDLIIAIIDNVGGVELEVESEKLRYTGLQVAELLKRSNSLELRRQVIIAACEKIRKYGVNSAFFGDVINKSETNLNHTDCYFWHEYLGEICANIRFID